MNYRAVMAMQQRADVDETSSFLLFIIRILAIAIASCVLSSPSPRGETQNLIQALLKARMCVTTSGII